MTSASYPLSARWRLGSLRSMGYAVEDESLLRSLPLCISA